ncbi:MAG: ABC transporter permease [Thermogemmata sp.]|jgi:phospholipid/cholesterol/gamma-HCH transport system permease protein|uniref:ABC transporter permease n=1 Tax=Thermogemmata fonticola TaxID=2755323 RepID=A0A7V8VDC6_9BACT|nr:ABC transporter permease [Thermogemmata fonticola]MBA2225871.1 ABC transporter permease [Thermogemmata fonticola]
MIEAKPDAPSSSPPSSPATRQADGLSARNQAFREVLEAVGDFTLFALHAWGGLFRGHFSRLEWFRIAAEVGNASAPVVAITGAFIGMVLAVQAYDQFHLIGMETSLGAVIHMSLVRELGPVLASVMVAGRVGSAMAAEIATMRVSEQLDALTCLGLDPVHYLVAPRLLACLIMVPLLTVIADLTGMIGSTFICVGIYPIDSFHYWRHTREFVAAWDVLTGLAKAMVFGVTLCLLACHRGFHSQPGAAGVGRAATQAFVHAFVAILILDFFLAMFFNSLYALLWPEVPHRLA